MLKDFVSQFQQKKDILDLQEKEEATFDNILGSNKNSFFNNYIIDIFLFITTLISLIVNVIVINVVCKHAKLKTLVASIALQQVKGTNAALDQDRFKDVYCICKIQWYTIAMLLLILLLIIFIVTSKVRKLEFI